MTHTPGPWELWTNDKGAFMISVDNGTMIICQRNDIEHRAEQSKANGHLLAAALDMLALLKDTGCPAGGWTGTPDDMQPTVSNCMKHGNCGCMYGDVVRKAENG